MSFRRYGYNQSDSGRAEQKTPDAPRERPPPPGDFGLRLFELAVALRATAALLYPPLLIASPQASAAKTSTAHAVYRGAALEMRAKARIRLRGSLNVESNSGRINLEGRETAVLNLRVCCLVDEGLPNSFEFHCARCPPGR